MSVAVYDVIDMEIETTCDTNPADKKKSQTAKLERRRRIEELHEEKSMRDDWDDF